jgi:hypothetical protein
MGGVGGETPTITRAAGALSAAAGSPPVKMALSGAQIDRYSRQILVPEIGGRGQERLLASRVTCLGESASLQVAISYLAAAGVRISGDAPPPPAADLLLIGANDALDAEDSAATDCPAMIAGETDRTAWYSRHTTGAHCLRCVVGAGNHAARDPDDGRLAVAAAPVAGAAMALDVIAELLGLAAGGPPALVVFSHGGRERRRFDLSIDTCPHRVLPAGGAD